MFSTIRSIEKVNYWVFKFDLNVPFVLHVGQVTHLSQVLHVRNIAILSKNIYDNLTATEINILWKQEKKNIKTVIRCRDGRPKVCKQGRNDIKVKVNIQSPLPTTFYTIQLHFTVRKLQRWGFVYSPSLLYCLHTSLTCYPYILLHFYIELHQISLQYSLLIHQTLIPVLSSVQCAHVHWHMTV